MIFQPDKKWTLNGAGPSAARETEPLPKRAIAVMLSGIAILVISLLVPIPKDYIGIPLLIGSLLFMMGMRVTIDELPDRPVPSWLGLSIVIVLGLGLPAALLVAFLWSQLS